MSERVPKQHEPHPSGLRPSAPGNRILFITSNGVGMGHLTRSLAIARRLDASLQPLVITLSGAAPVVRELGFPVEYVASHTTPTAGSDLRWERRLRGRVRAAIAEARPSVAIFDGVQPYPRMLEAIATAPEMTRVWCRRALWRPGANRGAIERESRFDAVLEPGELAAARDRGATVSRRARAHIVDPIVFCDEGELLPREQAERELGLEPGRLNVLVHLGQGPELRGALERCLSHLAKRPEAQVAATRSAIAEVESAPEGIVRLHSSYPMSRYYRAFDLAVSAAGYNAYHELIRFRVPTLFVAMPRETDDQPARAAYARESGVGMGLEDPGSSELESLLDRMLDAGTREAICARLGALEALNGAGEAAAWVAELAAERPTRAPGGRRGALSGLVPSPGRVKAGIAFAAQTVRRPPARTVVLALRVDPAELEHALPHALRDTPDPPERVLVITDCLNFGALRQAGVGYEQIPAQGELQPRLAGGSYDEFVRRRLALILAERPAPRRVLAIGGVDPALVELAMASPRARRRLLGAHPPATLSR
jgi:UDP:flavonoid glycosyltransferase YjiC (YdhE family)